MKQFVLSLKKSEKRNFLLELFEQLDFVEVKAIEKKETTDAADSDDYDFFQSAGLFKNRDIDAVKLRKQTWQ